MKASLNKIKTQDGIILHGVVYEPDSSTRKVVAHVHGMGGNFYENYFLQPIASVLTDNGISFSPFNNRGNGFVTELMKETKGGVEYVDGGDYKERFEDCILDIRAHIDFLEAQGYDEIHLSGHSLGAPKVVYYMSKTKDPRVKSVILLSPSDMLGLVRGKDDDIDWWIKTAEVMIAAGNGDEIMPKKVWGSYPITAGTYLNLFGDESNTAIFNFLNPDKGFDTLSQVTVPICAIMGTKDDVLVIPIEGIMQLIKENAAVDGSETHTIDDATHSYYKHEEKLANLVSDWVAPNS